ncbi:hypothetical protein AGMMS49546_22850 [Spirochaetia bacterium]|nr:hypothetical protein AGMMS49546_22850 [Spirochaetia bacterium]
MASFDVSKEWVILAPLIPAVQTAAAELSSYIEKLRERAGLAPKAPAIKDAAGPAPADSVPIILLNADAGDPGRSGFTWRMGRGRVEIYGDSGRGLCNGVFDFLAALGIRWPEPGREELPPPPAQAAKKTSGKPELPCAAYPLRDDRAYAPSDTALQNRRRLMMPLTIAPEKVKPRDLEPLVQWAARNRIDALVFSLREKSLWKKFLRDNNPRGKKSRRLKLFETAGNYALIIEWGGWDLSFLVPRRYFFINRELFRMDSGKRLKQYNFCPTNHETIKVLKKQAAAIFREADSAAGGNEGRIYHLWPDRGEERTWCSCPACRAFSPEEQNRIAVNAAADALAETDPKARLSWYEENGDSPESELPLRKNLFRLTDFPQSAQ